MERKTLTHTGDELERAISQFVAEYTPETYTLPEQVIFTVSLDPSVPKVHLVWLWVSTEFASGIMIRKKAGALPEHSLDGVEVCNIVGTSTTTYDDVNFDIDDANEVGRYDSPVKWYYRAFPYNSIGQRQTHYQTTLNRGTCNVNVYYAPDSTTLAFMELGDYFRFGHYGSTYLKWKIVDKLSDRVRVIMDVPMNSSDLGNVQFDAPEPDNPNSSRRSYGNNRWAYSNLRQWLNSDGEKLEWFEKQTDYDVCANSLLTKDGFLHDFLPQERSIIIPEQHLCALSSTDGSGSETVLDLVWLPSLTEMALGNVGGFDEGTVFQYFSGDGNTDSRRAEGYSRNYWLRSASVGSSYSVWYVSAGGGSIGSNANNRSFAVRAGLTLPLSTVIVWNSTDSIFEVQVV